VILSPMIQRSIEKKRFSSQILFNMMNNASKICYKKPESNRTH